MLPVNELKTLNLLNIMWGSTFFIQPEAMLIYLGDKPYDKCFDRHPAFFFYQFHISRVRILIKLSLQYIIALFSALAN